MDMDFLQNIFPLPSPDEPEDLKLCRDEYIQKIFAPYEEEYKRKICMRAKKEEEESNTEEIKVQVEEEDNIFEKLRNDLGRPIQALDFIFLNFAQPEKDKIENKVNKWDMHKYSEMVVCTPEMYDEATKKAAFKYAIFQIIEELMTISSISHKKGFVLPYKLFSWSLDELKERTETENTIHFDIMQFELSEEALNGIKFNVDVRELMKLFHLINDAIDDDDFRYVIKLLRDCELAANYHKQYHTAPRDRYNRLVESYFAATSGRIDARSITSRSSKFQLDYLQDCVDIIDPIRNRYRTKWCKTTSYQSYLKNQMVIDDLKQKIAKIRKAKNDAEFVSECTLTHLNMQIINYRQSYNELLAKFDEDYEIAVNDAEVSRFKMQKAKDDMVFYKEQVEMFHQRIKEVNAAIAEEEAQNQRISEHPPEVKKKPKNKGKGKAKRTGKEKEKKY